ncbi:MAG: amidophosphoribosyltransferase [Alphaproteobacteria bacterium]
MCGVIGVVGQSHINHYIYDALGLLQHRGQDACGIATLHRKKFYLHKDVGMVSDVFNMEKLSSLLGRAGIGHVRYPTAGNPGVSESQPFYVNNPHGVMLAHNGNITNVDELKQTLHEKERRHLNTDSDSELLLNCFAYGLNDWQHHNAIGNDEPTADAVFHAVKFINEHAKGGYACTALVAGLGLVAFRDNYGIRPLVLGKQETENGTAYMIASESAALDITAFELVRDIEPGEAIVITKDGKVTSSICSDKTELSPCLFEYVYFARPDSIINDVSVYECRVDAGKALGDHLKNVWADKDIDVVIPVPETGRVAAQEIAAKLKVQYREGFVKNRYVGRTFIMPTAVGRVNSVRRKLNPIPTEFKGKNVLLVDDSIVRGTTSKKIIEMVRDLGAKNVYLASASPEVCFPNVYGIDMPTRSELLAHNRSLDEIKEWIGVDAVEYLPLEKLKGAIANLNPKIKSFEDSVFSGNYITGGVDEKYLDNLENKIQKENKAEEKRLSFIASNLTANI